MAEGRSQKAWLEWVDSNLSAIRSKDLERVLRPLVPTDNSVQALIHQDEHTAWLSGNLSPDSCTNLSLNPQDRSPAIHKELKPLTLFSLNDYLGLSTHPAVKAAAAAAAMQAGCGPRSSALVGGFTSEHRQLELELAALKGSEDALLFPTGYAANVAVMTVLASVGSSSNTSTATVSSSSSSSSFVETQQQQQQQQVIIFSDELNHASIIDGLRLAVRSATAAAATNSTLTAAAAAAGISSLQQQQRAASSGDAVQPQVYRHNDLYHLEGLLKQAPAAARKLVVTDSLFSMDGDFADLPGLVRLKHQYGFLFVVDDAHATLVCGQHGGGAAEMMQVSQHIDIHVGTLSKAAGALGGFVTCSSAMRQLLLNRGRSVIYSTSLPVPVVAAARAALRVSRSESWRRQHVWSLSQLVSHRLNIPAASPIIPLVVGSESAAITLSKSLLQKGYHVPAIRPPTVPEGTCRLRVSLSAGHTRAQVERFICDVQECLRELPGVQLMKLPHLLDRRQQRYLQQLGQQQQQGLEQQQQQQGLLQQQHFSRVDASGMPSRSRL